MFTHLHQDHCRGATWSGELTFPQATGFAHAAEVAFWSGAEAAGVTADEHLASAREAIMLFGDRLRPFDHDAEILPGVHIVDAAGHTPGHSAVLLQSDGERLLCVGDLFYDQLQLSRPEWSTPWDHDTVRAVRTRRRLLDRAADYDTMSPSKLRPPAREGTGAIGLQLVRNFSRILCPISDTDTCQLEHLGGGAVAGRP